MYIMIIILFWKIKNVVPKFYVSFDEKHLACFLDDLVDPGFVSDQETDLPQTKARCQHTLTVRKIGITHTEGERKAPMEPPEEEGSLMEFPFAFSPLVSVLSPLPPSPQSYRKVRHKPNGKFLL